MAVPNLNFTLYPPIVDTYMPAFINDDACTVYFSLSSYNSLEDIRGLQFTVKRQANNVTALRDGKQMITLDVNKIQKTLNEMGEIQYSFVIKSSLIQNQEKIFEEIKLFKQQLEMIIESDKDDIKSWITEKHHFYCYERKWIDDYSMDCIEKRYRHYKDEGGNSFIEELMNELRSLPKTPPQ